MIVKRWSKRLKKFTYHVRLINEYGIKKQYPGTFISRKDAKLEESRLKLEIEEKRRHPKRETGKRKPEETTFTEWVKEYLEIHADMIRSKRNYHSTAKILVDYFGDNYLSDISQFDVLKYKSMRLKSGVHISTVNKDLAMLSGIFTKFSESVTPINNPVKGIKRRRDAPRQRYLKAVEAKKLIMACRKGYLKWSVIVDLHSGLRVKKELYALKWKDGVDFKNNLIHVVDGKGGKERSVPMAGEAKKALLELYEKRKGEYV